MSTVTVNAYLQPLMQDICAGLASTLSKTSRKHPTALRPLQIERDIGITTLESQQRL